MKELTQEQQLYLEEIRNDPLWAGDVCAQGHPMNSYEAYVSGICPICFPEENDQFWRSQQ
jgi:hypothetical protein